MLAELFLDDVPLDALLFLPLILEILLDGEALLTETGLVPDDLRETALFVADLPAEDRPFTVVFFALPLDTAFLDALFFEDLVN